MMTGRRVYAVLGTAALCAIGLGLFWSWCDAGTASDAAMSPAVPQTQAPVSREPIQPIPRAPDLDPRKVALGERLFRDPHLSRDNRIACASCHDLQKGGTDRSARSLGVNRAVGDINAPTVFNCGLNFKQFWDGRADTLEMQVDGPVQHPKEMASGWSQVLPKLRHEPTYVASFDALYPDGIQAQNIRDAIATFERSLLTPNSRFDQFLRGDTQALADEEQQGYRLFKSSGCVSCHQGVNVGGNMFQTFGVMMGYPRLHGQTTRADRGRYNVTGRYEDLHVFKVPGLRNVALTPPYFHDGSAHTLEQAVSVMAQYQLGHPLDALETRRIVRFLKSLTGEYKGVPL